MVKSVYSIDPWTDWRRKKWRRSFEFLAAGFRESARSGARRCRSRSPSSWGRWLAASWHRWRCSSAGSVRRCVPDAESNRRSKPCCCRDGRGRGCCSRTSWACWSYFGRKRWTVCFSLRHCLSLDPGLRVGHLAEGQVSACWRYGWPGRTLWRPWGITWKSSSRFRISQNWTHSLFCKCSNSYFNSFFKAPLPPYWLLLGSPMLMDPHPSQQHAGLHHASYQQFFNGPFL